MPCRFPELSFSFPVLPSFCLLCVSFSKNAFFTSWLYLLLLCLEICFAFILLPLGSLYWLTHHAFLITLKPLHGIWFFVFYINFSLHDSLEIPVSEHLQWLKFKKRNCELYLQTTGRAAQVAQLYSSGKIRCLYVRCLQCIWFCPFFSNIDPARCNKKMLNGCKEVC